MSRILIIGSEGQLGSELSKFLKSNTDSSKIILSDIKEKSNTDLKYFKINALKSTELEVFVKDYNISDDNIRKKMNELNEKAKSEFQ